MSKVSVESISFNDAIKRISDVYAGNKQEFLVDLNKAVLAAENRSSVTTETAVNLGTETKSRLKM